MTSNAGKYVKKPVVIEAVQWTGKNYDECMNFMESYCGNKLAYEDYEEQCIETGEILINTPEGRLTASKNDWIIKGVKGEFYPCKPDIFDLTYNKYEE